MSKTTDINTPEFRETIRQEATKAGLGDDVTVTISVVTAPDRFGILEYKGLALKVVSRGTQIAETPLLDPRGGMRNVRTMRRTFKRAARALRKFPRV